MGLGGVTMVPSLVLSLAFVGSVVLGWFDFSVKVDGFSCIGPNTVTLSNSTSECLSLVTIGAKVSLCLSVLISIVSVVGVGKVIGEA